MAGLARAENGSGYRATFLISRRGCKKDSRHRFCSPKQKMAGLSRSARRSLVVSLRERMNRKLSTTSRKLSRRGCGQKTRRR